MPYKDKDEAQALVDVIGDSRWDAVAFARGYLAMASGASPGEAARIAYDAGGGALGRNRELFAKARTEGLFGLLQERERKGSAENAIPKLFPATITEERFIEELDRLRERRSGVEFSDEREAGHGLTDFTLVEDGESLPINIKNAGTRFERAQDLVGLAPDDCVPIPAYKAHAAVEAHPSLLYVVSVDYGLISRLTATLPGLLSLQERQVWGLLQRLSGARLRSAEDAFVFRTVRKYWASLKPLAATTPFQVISARKSLRILQTNPKRTPGVGLRAWGTGASAEVNVHVSVANEMTPWETVAARIEAKGIHDVIGAVNRRRTEEVYDPEI